MKMDRWKAKELKQMEFGGNKSAKTYYEKNVGSEAVLTQRAIYGEEL